jgi:uncharacterized protein YjbI with pentapeptide repeats
MLRAKQTPYSILLPGEETRMNSKPSPSHKSLRAPVLPKKMQARGLPDGRIHDHEHYTQLMLVHDDLTNQVAQHIFFEETLFKQVGMGNTRLSSVQTIDVRFTECDFSNGVWQQLYFQRVELVGCQLMGWHAIEGHFQDTLFKSCRSHFCQFRFSTFKSVQFEDCDLSDADFQGADLSGVKFVNCKLRNVEMSGAKLRGADLRGSHIDGLRAGLPELQGAIIDPAQALALVEQFGITVKSPDNPM